ncbi:hypothetical protein ACFSRY_10855 [Pontibacter locisalis]|uniref:Outer membrane protein beta-barrel domain-containing protein n=1 Tax=Pontibacter locisalis TaxID=1719035 RepID=A0ABW5IN47_9BACT
MKRLILLACCMFALLQASAQIQPKSYFITTDVGLNTQKDGRGNDFHFYQVSTSVSSMVSEKWAAGVFAEYGRGISEVETTNDNNSFNMSFYEYYKQKRSSWHFGSQARFYYPVKLRLYVFGEGRVGVKYESADSEYLSSSFVKSDPERTTAKSGGSEQTSALSVQGVVSPGIAYFLTPKIGLELKLNLLHYNHILDDSTSPDGAEHPHDFSADFGLSSTRIGASFYF